MSQTWNFPMASSATLSDSRSYINDSCESLRTSFSGTSPPGSPPTGQQFFNTSSHEFNVYDTSSWYTIFNTNTTWGGLVPRSGGSAYPMSGDLYMGSNLIQNLADPVANTDAATKGWTNTNYLALSGGTMSGVMVCGSYLPTASANPSSDTQLARKAYVDLHVEKAGDTMTGDLSFGSSYTATGLAAPSAADDAATKSYVDDEFDTSTGHDHDGTDSKKVEYTNIAATGSTAWGFLEINPSDATVARQYDLDSTEADQTCPWAEWYTVASVTLSVHNAEPRIVLAGFYRKENDDFGWRIRRDSTTIAENPYTLSEIGGYTFGAKDTMVATASVTFTLQIYATNGPENVSQAWLLVL